MAEDESGRYTDGDDDEEDVPAGPPNADGAALAAPKAAPASLLPDDFGHLSGACPVVFSWLQKATLGLKPSAAPLGACPLVVSGFRKRRYAVACLQTLRSAFEGLSTSFLVASESDVRQ